MRTNRMKAVAVSIAIIVSLPVIAARTASAAVEGDGPTPTRAEESSAQAHWREAGRWFNKHYNLPFIATSSSGVFAAAATRIDSSTTDPKRVALVRRLPGGAVQRAAPLLGHIWAVDVDPRGHILVIGALRKRVLAVSWRPSAARPTTQLAFDGSSFPGLGISGSVSVNARGDAAVLTIDRQQNAFVARKNAVGTTWRKPIKVTPDDYGAQLRELALAPQGRVVGAFLHDHSVDLRTLKRASRTFGDARPAVSWPGIDDLLDSYDEQVHLRVGPRGDKVVALCFSYWIDDFEHPAYAYRYTFLPVGEQPYSGEKVDDFNDPYADPVIGADGSVAVEGAGQLRWEPSSRQYDSAGLKARLTANPRGDLLLRRDADAGALSIWALGEAPRETGAAPRGDAVAWAITNRYRTYVLTERRGEHPGYYLSIGRLSGR